MASRKSSAGRNAHASKPAGITVVKNRNGSVGWRVAGGRARAVRSPFGKIHAVEGDGAADSAAYKRSIRLIQAMLREMAASDKVARKAGKPAAASARPLAHRRKSKALPAAPVDTE